MHDKRPLVGVAVIIRKNRKVLLGKRRNAHGEGTWQFPGGHLEYFESIENCAKREVWEETGLKIKNLKCATFTNDIFEKEKKHYITLFITADYEAGRVRVMEPHKCQIWKWYKWPELTDPLFLPIINLLKQQFDPFV